MKADVNIAATEITAISEDAALPPISKKYLLVINIPLYRDKDGVAYAEHLWFKDLAAHLTYISDFAIACPRLERDPGEPSVSLRSDPRVSRVKIIDLPSPQSAFRAILSLPRTANRLWRAIRNAEVIHTGIAGWPIPYGWIATPMARILGKKLVIIVESAPWRINVGLSRTFKSSIKAILFERLARWCVSLSDLAIFTQEEYRLSLLKHKRNKGHVIHASWIDEDVIISDEYANAIWQKKIDHGPRELAILFAGRLDSRKGVSVLIKAIRLVARKEMSVRLDILGSGELAAQCEQVSAELDGSTRVNMLGKVAYGAPLFELLRRYHALILPSISDEQPRIVYDAYSQGVPILATRTPGLLDCIWEGRTGWLVEPNDADQLSDVIDRAARNVAELQHMGMEALRVAREMTHQRMHRERHRLLLQLIPASVA